MGVSTHQLAKKLGEISATKATHTGTLDPLAEGVIVVLSGEDRFLKSKIADNKKTYSAEILLGISTDTDDELGVITAVNKNVTTEDIELFCRELSNSVGEQLQVIHPYSAKRHQGTSYFNLAKAKIETPDYYQAINIEKVQLDESITISAKELLRQQNEKVGKVEGAFRQKEILSSWSDTFLKHSLQSDFTVINCTIVCSKRTYIRSLVKKVSTDTKVPAVLHYLLRTNNGPYSVEDCICLI